MNPETKQDMDPQVEQPHADTPATEAFAAETDLPVRKRSSLWMFFDAWTDRDLDLSRIDTSDWNIYYYYFRHIYQKRATVKLKYMRWIALVFQVLFFGAYALGITLFLLFHAKADGRRDFSAIFFVLLSVTNMFALQYLLPLFPFLPLFIVCPAFKLRAKNRGFMTSRAKEPPLLSHLVQYTTSKGLVAGALQSLLFTWRKFFLLLLPCIVVSVLSLIFYTAFIATTPREVTMALGLPVGILLFILTLSMFFVMQTFCFRMDSLLIIIFIGILGVMTLFDLGESSASSSGFWIALGFCYVPACIVAAVYFALAAVDTNDYGLGKRAPKAIRILLYSLAGVFLALILAGGTGAFGATKTGGTDRLLDLVLNFTVYGLFSCVFGLLVTSVSVTSHNAELLRRKQPDMPFWKKLFDPASPVSLVPVFVLELVSLFVINVFARKFAMAAHGGFGSGVFFRNFWAIQHVALAVIYMRQWNDPTVREPWNSHVRFNSYVFFSAALIFLLQLLFSITISINHTKNMTSILVTIFYILSFIVWFFAVYYVHSHPDRQRFEQIGAPADTGSSIPGQGRDDGEAL